MSKNDKSVIFRCACCDVTLTVPLTELIDKSLLDNKSEHDYIPRGLYIFSLASEFYNLVYWPGHPEQYFVNLLDLIGTQPHAEAHRIDGCCGPDGTQGVNELCANGHEIGTRRSDCYQSHVMLLDPRLVEQYAV